jgi:hypothetical protein
MNDPVNSPSHYQYGRFEVIDVLEEAVRRAPDPVKGSLQYQVLKYMLRLWSKENPLQDAQKSRWYLSRLIEKMEAEVKYDESYTKENNEGQ